MQIKRIKVKNFKTYLSLDLDLSVEEERPIILIGGMNGGGKTTLFESIYGALYGLKIKNEKNFNELINSGSSQEQQIDLELTFTGNVLNQEQTYVLKRSYILNSDKRPVESVRLNMNGSIFMYGTATPATTRVVHEAQVNKIIKANLPQELSRYFLFDAMEAGNLLKEDQLNRVIKENIENVMGFNKYQLMSRVSQKLLQKYSAERIQVENEQQEYMNLADSKNTLEKEINDLNYQLGQALQYSTQNKELYENLKSGLNEDNTLRNKLENSEVQIENIKSRISTYRAELDGFVSDFESRVLLPHLVNSINNEVALIIKTKDERDQQNREILDTAQIHHITEQVIEYLANQKLYNTAVNLSDIVEYILNNQKDISKSEDDYRFLDDLEVEALKNLVNSSYSNTFPLLSQSKVELDNSFQEMPSLLKSIDIIKQQISGNDYSSMKAYEENENLINTLQNLISEKNSEIKKLENRLHQYDVQIQEEPDPKYDTLVKMQSFFDDVANKLLKIKKSQIETRMKDYLNVNLTAYKDVIGRVELSEELKDLNFRIYHISGNEISLNQLNAGSKQLLIQVLLKVLHELGDYDPPVMIDTVMGVLDRESRETMMENYFPELSDQTILLSTDTEIRTTEDYEKLQPFISKTYTLQRDRERQCTEVIPGYFGIQLNN